MLSQPLQSKFSIAEGREVIIETGKLARQADGSVTVRQGDCIILATVVANKEPKEGQSFFPLTVDYQEKFASAGRIPGSFFKREARLNDYEILTSRLIDRALRPLFPEDYYCEAKECSEADLVNALQIAHDAIRIQIQAQQELRNKAGVQGKRDYKKPEQN